MTAFTDSYLLFSIDKFSFSLKQQIRNSKKCYAIDPGQINALAFKFSENYGRLLENVIFLELRRRNFEVYTYKTENDLEVDFVVKKKNEITLIQVAQNLESEITRKREIQSLASGLKALSLTHGLIITTEQEEEISYDGLSIKIMPAYKFLIEPLVLPVGKT